MPAPELLEELIDWLRIPSISTEPAEPDGLERAARWVVDRVVEAGGQGELVRVGDGNPLAVGRLAARSPDAPTILIYGHYDVQGPGPPEAWITPPFDPRVRDGRLYARGASDDKGNFLPLLHEACALARADALPVHVRVLVEGEEELGGDSVAEWVRSHAGDADAAVVFDSAMVDADTPALTVGLRGLVAARLRVTVADRNLHSGLYGGSVLNALHVLHAMLARVIPGPDGRVREELRAGVLDPTPEELHSWERLPPGDRVLANAGGRPVYPGAGADYYRRNGADAALDVNAIVGGEPRTIVPPSASAHVSLRLAPGQDPEAMRRELERLLREGLAPGAELEIDWQLGAPALFDPRQPALRLAREAVGRACGTDPLFVRSGGSIPVVAEMAAAGLPVIVGGFALAEDAIHAPNESFSLRSLELGAASARELYRSLAGLREG